MFHKINSISFKCLFNLQYFSRSPKTVCNWLSFLLMILKKCKKVEGNLWLSSIIKWQLINRCVRTLFSCTIFRIHTWSNFDFKILLPGIIGKSPKNAKSFLNSWLGDRQKLNKIRWYIAKARSLLFQTLVYERSYIDQWLRNCFLKYV